MNGTRRFVSLTLAALASCGGEHGGPPGWLSKETIALDAHVRVERVEYLSDGLRVVGQLCRPNRAGAFPVAVYNHGGWSGLGEEWGALDGGCADLARLGWVAAMSSYRGEDGSDGSVEICSGEASDVLAMLEIVRRDPFATDRAVMLGVSHGGCVAVRALQNGAPVSRAVSLNGPTDLAGVYENALARAPAPFFSDLLAAFDLAFGGSPIVAPDVYRARSTIEDAASLAAHPAAVLLQHGEADEVVPAEQSCLLAEAAGGFQAFHVKVNGQVTTHAPPACAGLDLEWSAGPLPLGDWPGSRYLVIYDGEPHAGGANQPLVLGHLVDFLGVL